jgi:hypothetical protein
MRQALMLTGLTEDEILKLSMLTSLGSLSHLGTSVNYALSL